MEELDQSSLHPLLEHLEANMCVGRESNPGCLRFRRALKQRAIRTVQCFSYFFCFLMEGSGSVQNNDGPPRSSKKYGTLGSRSESTTLFWTMQSLNEQCAYAKSTSNSQIYPFKFI
jgi:hypothetical protein